VSTTVFARQQQRYDTAAEWASVNPVLLSGEIGIESDTGKFKFGDDVSTWNTLPYASGTSSSGGTLAIEVHEHTTASLAPGATEDFSIPAGTVFKLLSVEASTPAWVRVYGTTAARSADARTQPGPPIPGSGADFYAELATVATPQTIKLSPVPTVQGTSGSAFIRVGNRDTAARVISLDFTTLKLGA
jgi:hypothetical protein